jgi:hypothetical protein
MNDSATIVRDYLIPETALPKLVDRIGQIARRAARVGVVAPVLTVGEHVASAKLEEWDALRNDPSNVKRIVRLFAVTLTGERPCFEGWHFGATLQHLGEHGNVVLGFEEVPARYRDAGPDCDHCRVARKRAETFVLAHEDGRFVQVGRTCLQDFLPRAPIAAMADAASFLADAIVLCDSSRDYDSEGGGSFSPWLDLGDFVVACATAVRINGGYEANGGTRNRAMNILFPGKGRTEAQRREETPTDADRELARNAMAWCADLTDDEVTGDYLYNLRTIARSCAVHLGRTAGLAASMIVAYDRNLAKRREAVKPSAHFGTVGKRETFVLTVDRVIPIESQYGIAYLHIMHDDAGNVAKWKASGTALDLGERYSVVGTVKAHGDYNGKFQTELTRCKARAVKAEAA